MKKTLLLATLCLPMIYMYAQEINKDLLYGKWQQYSATSKGKTIYRDSLDRFIEATVKERNGDNPEFQLSPDDSVAIAKEAKVSFDDIFKSYVIIDREKYTVLFCKKGDCKEVGGDYTWVSGNVLTSKGPDAGSGVIVTIISVTADRLVLKSLNKENASESEITFTRMKK